MSGYLRRHHIGLVAIFIALSGTAVAAFDPVGSDGDIDACFNKKKQLSVAKGEKCKKGSKLVSWSQTGPAGPQGAAGQTGATGPAGTAGLDGSARAYGLVQASGFLTNSKNASVTRPTTGTYCVSVSGVSSSTGVILLTADYAGIVQGVASWVATDAVTDDPMSGTPSSNPVALWDTVPETCPSGQFEVQTARQRIDSNTHEGTVFNAFDAGFAFMVP